MNEVNTEFRFEVSGVVVMLTGGMGGWWDGGWGCQAEIDEAQKRLDQDVRGHVSGGREYVF